MGGSGASSCGSAEMNSFVADSAQGYTKGNLKACFYTSDDCTTKSSSDYAMISGGDTIDDGDCVSVGEQFFSYKITEDSCTDDYDPSDVWVIKFSTHVSPLIPQTGISGIG